MGKLSSLITLLKRYLISHGEVKRDI